MDKGGKLYRGWFIVAVCACMMGIVFVPIFSIPGIFQNYVTEEFGCTRAAFSLHTSISTFACIFVSFFIGKLFSKSSIKRFYLVAALISAAGFLAYSFATRIWQFYVISAIAGCAGIAQSHITVAAVVNNWFGPRLKGKAMGIAMAGSGIGAMLLSPLLTSINKSMGWRSSYRILAAMVVVIVIPLVQAIIVRTPGELGLKRLGEDSKARGDALKTGYTMERAVRTPMFWFCIVAFFISGILSMIHSSHAYSFYTDIGISEAKASSYISILSFILIFSKIGLGAIADRKGTKVSAVCMISAYILAFMTYVVAIRIPALSFLGVVFYGIANAFPTVVGPLIVQGIFGNRSFASLNSILHIGSYIGSASGVMVGAMVYDATGSYSGAWVFCAAMAAALMALVLVSFALKPRYPEEQRTSH